MSFKTYVFLCPKELYSIVKRLINRYDGILVSSEETATHMRLNLKFISEQNLLLFKKAYRSLKNKNGAYHIAVYVEYNDSLGDIIELVTSYNGVIEDTKSDEDAFEFFVVFTILEDLCLFYNSLFTN